MIVSSGVLAVGRANMSNAKANRTISFGSAVFYWILWCVLMKDIYSKGGYVSDEPYVSPPIIHRSECPPFTLNKSGEKTGALDPRIDHGITKQIMDIIESNRNLKLLKENRIRLLNYNHMYSTEPFKQCCAEQLSRINSQIKNIENAFLEEARLSKFSIHVEWSHLT